MHAPNNRASRYMNQDVKGETDKSTMEDFHTPLSSITEQTEHQREILKNTMNQFNLINIFRNLHSTTEYTFFSAHKTFTNTNNILHFIINT